MADLVANNTIEFDHRLNELRRRFAEDVRALVASFSPAVRSSSTKFDEAEQAIVAEHVAALEEMILRMTREGNFELAQSAQQTLYSLLNDTPDSFDEPL